MIKMEIVEKEKKLPYVGLEQNLIQIGYFSISTFRDKDSRPNDEKKIKLTRLEIDGVNSSVEIVAPRRSGLPTTSDLTKYLAFQDIIQDFIAKRIPIPNPILFTNYQLLSRAKIARSKKEYDAVQSWLERMATTSVHFSADHEKGYLKEIVRVFERVRMTGDILDNGDVADCNHVYLSEWAIHSLQNRIPIDFEAYRKLTNQMAKLLVPHLQVWLFGSRKSNLFTKNYSDFCALLGMQEYKHPSLMIQKLEKPMQQLKDNEYISAWELEKSKRDGYNINITHGPRFFRDQKHHFLVNQRSRGELAPNIPTTTDPSFPSFPQAVPDFTDEQKEAYDLILTKDIDKKGAKAIARTLSLEEIKNRILFCEYLFQDTPGRVRSERGYIFTILSDPEFELPESFHERHRAIQRAVDQYLEEQKQQQEWEAAQEDLSARLIEYEAFCLQNAPEVDERAFYKSHPIGERLWADVLNAVGKRLNEQIVSSWFSPTQFICFNSDETKIVVSGPNICIEWIKTYYSALINQALLDLERPNLEVEWLIAERPVKIAIDFDEDEDDRKPEPLTKKEAYRFYRIYLYQRSGLTFEQYTEANKSDNEN